MHTGILRWSGLFGMLGALLFVGAAASEISSGVNIYAGDKAEALAEFDKTGPALGAVLAFIFGQLSNASLLVFLLGLFVAVRGEDRPLGGFAVGAMGLGVALEAVSYGFHMALVESAEDFAAVSEGTRTALVAQAETLVVLYGIFQGIGFALMGIGAAAITRPLLRSAVFPRWLGWLTAAWAVLAFLFPITFFVAYPVFVLWLLAMGWTMFARGRTPTVEAGVDAAVVAEAGARA